MEKLFNYFREYRFDRRFNRWLSDNSIASRSYYISASVLFSLFVTNSAIIYYSTILTHTETSLALEIVQQAIVNPPRATIYLKNDQFQYLNYLEDLKDIVSYLETQDVYLPFKLVPRGGELFPTPNSLKPLSRFIDQKKSYQILAKIMSGITFGAFIGLNYKGFVHLKEVHNNLLKPFLANPEKAQVLSQCLELYLESNNLSNVMELIARPKLWPGLYNRFSLLVFDFSGMAKGIDYYKCMSYALYLSGVNTNFLIAGTLLTLNSMFILGLTLITLLPVGSAALPTAISSSIGLIIMFSFTKLDFVLLGSFLSSLPDGSAVMEYLNLFIRKFIQNYPSKISSPDFIDVASRPCDPPSLGSSNIQPPTSSPTCSPNRLIMPAMPENKHIIDETIKYLK